MRKLQLCSLAGMCESDSFLPLLFPQKKKKTTPPVFQELTPPFGPFIQTSCIIDLSLGEEGSTLFVKVVSPDCRQADQSWKRRYRRPQEPDGFAIWRNQL